MKARVIATEEIVEVIAVSDYINENGQIIGEYKDADGMLYNSYDLDFYIEEGITIPDYWTRLEHQYAGMAIQGLLSNSVFFKDADKVTEGKPHSLIVIIATEFAHALVEELKKSK